jgi:TBCC domain-containing protein 1
MAIMTLVDSPSDLDTEYADRMNGSLPYTRDADPEILQHRHDTEHGDIGLNVTLTADDIERLNLILQGPSGGMIHDPPLMISELMPLEDLAVYDKISLDKVEKEIRRHLELDLITIMDENAQMDDSVHIDAVTKDMGKLNFNENMEEEELSRDRKEKLKELKYSKIRGTTTILKPVSQQQTSSDLSQSPAFSSSGRLHDVHVSECSDAHMYLLQPFEHVTISACTGCTIVVGAVAGLLHVVNCEKTDIIVAARRVLLSNCVDVSHYLFTPSPPLLVGNNRCCQFAPYNTYYDGLREDLLATGLAAAILSPDNMGMGDNVNGPSLQCASNKWKHSLELTKQSDLLPIHIPPRSSSPLPGSASGTDDKALSEESMQTPTLVPASEFQLLFVPLQTEASRKRRVQYESEEKNNGIGSLYCHNLAEVLQLSPFRLPTEYERRAMIKADRIKMLQQAIKNELLPEQQVKLEEELNRRFRDWLVASGNLRQVIDLVHLDNKGVR